MSNEKGSALIFTLIIILLLTVLSAAVLEVTIMNYKVSQSYEDSFLAKYSAEAGLEKVKSEFTISLSDAYGKNDKGNGKGQFWLNIITNKHGTKIQYKKNASSLIDISALNIPIDQWIKLGNLGQEYKIDDIQITTPDPSVFETPGEKMLVYTFRILTEGKYKRITRYGYAEINYSVNVLIEKQGNSANTKAYLNSNYPQLPPVVEKWAIYKEPQVIE
ncbi:MAG: PilX N-terminal domain-containing pilus assembly protein [Thermoanaerobacteraceae bacterium]